jgi:hypothetical protein
MDNGYYSYVILFQIVSTHNSKVLASISEKYFDYWNKQYLYSSANKLWLMFDSRLVTNKTLIIPPRIRPKFQGIK